MQNSCKKLLKSLLPKGTYTSETDSKQVLMWVQRVKVQRAQKKAVYKIKKKILKDFTIYIVA